MAVLGDGPVGQTTALLLARWGLPVVVLDGRPGTRSAARRSASSATCSTSGTRSASAQQIAGRGRHLDDRAHLPPRRRAVQLLLRRGRAPRVPAVREHLAVPHRAAARRADRGRAADRGPLGPTGSPASSRTRPGVTLTCASGGERAVRSYVVVCCAGRADEGCAGARAHASTGETFDDHFLICDIRTDLPGWETERRFYFDPEWNPGRQVLIHPCPDSTFRIDWQVPAGLRPRRRGGLRRAGPADPADHRRPRLRDRLEVGLPLPLPGASTGCGSAGCWSPATPRTWSPRSAPAA